MINKVEYEPLRWPDENLKKASLYNLNHKAQKAFKEMQRIVQDRGPIPLEIWDNNPRRFEIARQLSRIIKESVGWTSDNFIPDDLFNLLCWGGWYDLREVEVLWKIEDHFIINILEDHLEMIWNFTLGQLVDYLLANAACPIPWPKNGEYSLEDKICPSFAAFIDIR
jgi:hypothetical protein